MRKRKQLRGRTPPVFIVLRRSRSGLGRGPQGGIMLAPAQAWEGEREGVVIRVLNKTEGFVWIK